MTQGKNKRTCTECDAEIMDVSHLGEKHIVNVEPTKGFVFLEDEYGDSIGTDEMTNVHLIHSSCENQEAEVTEETQEIIDSLGLSGEPLEPLADDDPRDDMLFFEDGNRLRATQEMRIKAPALYLKKVGAAVRRELPGKDGDGE